MFAIIEMATPFWADCHAILSEPSFTNYYRREEDQRQVFWTLLIYGQNCQAGT